VINWISELVAVRRRAVLPPSVSRPLKRSAGARRRFLLSRGMTYKAAAAGLNLGGGKAIIIGDPRRDKNESLFRDFAIDGLDAVESRDLYDLLLERYRTGSVVVTSNRGPDEWLATFADPVRAQSAIDRFTSNAYDLVIEGDSYRPRLKPRLAKDGKERSR
jgi:hypothetical protein